MHIKFVGFCDGRFLLAEPSEWNRYETKGDFRNGKQQI